MRRQLTIKVTAEGGAREALKCTKQFNAARKEKGVYVAVGPSRGQNAKVFAD
jgi:hypothetical protein